MPNILFVLLFFFLEPSALFVKSDILQVVSISRHCDRTPIHNDFTIPGEKDVTVLTGFPTMTLTDAGEHHCEILGKHFRRRYVADDSENRIRGISSKYHPDCYRFLSSQSKRTLRSAYSMASGLFPEGYNCCDNTTTALRNGAQSVPILSIQKKNDRIMKELDVCPKLMNKMIKTWEDKDLNDKYKPFFEEVSEKLNYKKINDIGEFYILHDYCTVNMEYSNSTPSQNLIDIYPEMDRVLGEVWAVRYNEDVIQGLAGNVFLETVLSHFDKKTLSRGEDFINYFSHDSALGIIIVALGLNEYPEFMYQPKFGASIIFELHSENNNYFVKILYKEKYDSDFKEYFPSKIGCENEFCSFSKFEDYVTKRRVNIGEWCEKCGNTKNEECVQKSYKTTKIDLAFEKNKNNLLTIEIDEYKEQISIIMQKNQNLIDDLEFCKNDIEKINSICNDTKKELEELKKQNKNLTALVSNLKEKLNQEIEKRITDEQKLKENGIYNLTFVSITTITTATTIIFATISLLLLVILIRMKKKNKSTFEYQKLNLELDYDSDTILENKFE